MLTQVIYVSRARDPMGADSDKAILDEAHERNAELGLTGFLFRTRSSFVQLLEGPVEAVETVMNLIRKDDRHHDLHEWPPNPVEERSFPDFGMGYDDVLMEREESFIAELQTPGISFPALRAHIELLSQSQSQLESERPLLTVARKLIGMDPGPDPAPSA